MGKQNYGGDSGMEAIFGSTYEAHSGLMGAIWGPGINIAIILAIYSYRKAWPIIHGIAGTFACIYSLACTLPIFNYTGIVSASSTIDPKRSGQVINAHYLVGIACMAVIGLQLILGIATKLVNVFQGKSNTILGVRKVHVVFGYLMVLLCKADIYIISGAEGFYIAQDIVLLILYIIRKNYFPMLEKTIAPEQETEPRLVRSIKELDRERDYVVFANYVYDTQPLKLYHPAGYQIVASVKNKEIDRYIYGMYASQELPEVPIHSHTFKSFTLMDAPVAKLDIPSPIKGYSSQNIPVRVNSLKLLSQKSRIYEMLLVPEYDLFQFEGYTDVSQLGQYYSISLNDKVTRLYTSVHFLHHQNRVFMQKYCPALEEGQQKSEPKTVRVIPRDERGGEYSASNVNLEEINSGKCLPILFKTYPGGKFTEGLVNGPIEKLVLSKAKGEGLQFAHLKPGKVLIAAGGTGLYPFSDLIDLLFKDQLATDRPELRPAIEKLSPVLASRPFRTLSFHLFAAFQSVDDVHPTTLQQLLYLSAHSARFALTLRLKEAARWLSDSKVELSGSGFEQLLGRQLRDLSGISRVWICGPPRMNEGLAKYLRETYKNSELYLIL